MMVNLSGLFFVLLDVAENYGGRGFYPRSLLKPIHPITRKMKIEMGFVAGIHHDIESHALLRVPKRANDG
jgi:hypothetical protein